ncbi:Uncharacterised protein [Mycobacterium tuberculosis]|nr:Uncharacterised protein [Mycobacterium tuberculosis]CKU13268.1 Uncharacterised protein [Mycobacterium tuberculosis]
MIILNVDPGGYRPVVATGPSASAPAFCAIARISPVDGLITTIIALPPRVFTACCAAFCTTRSNVIETDDAGDGATSCSTETSTPFWLTLTTRQPALPSSSSTTAFLTSLRTAGAKCLSVGSSSACGVITTPGSCPIAAATRLLSSACNVTRSNGWVDELACSASSCGSLSVSSKGCSAPTTACAVPKSSRPAWPASSE